MPSATAEKFQSGYAKKLKGGAEVFTLEGSRWALEKAAVIDGKLAMESLGVVYAFEEWQLEDGTICSPGGARRAPPMTPEEVRATVRPGLTLPLALPLALTLALALALTLPLTRL